MLLNQGLLCHSDVRTEPKAINGKSVLNEGRIRRIIVLPMKPFVAFELLVLLEDIFMCDCQKC